LLIKCELIAAVGLEDANGGGGAGLQLENRADRTRYKVAAAIGTEAAEFRLGAVATECAFKRADYRFGRFRGQILVAALAIGAQLQQEDPPKGKKVEIRAESGPRGRE
jgi:hypothetical protein